MGKTGCRLIVKEEENGEEFFRLDSENSLTYQLIIEAPSNAETKPDMNPQLHIEALLPKNEVEVYQKIFNWSMAESSKTKDAFKYLQLDYVTDNNIIEYRYIFPESFVTSFKTSVVNNQEKISLVIKDEKKSSISMKINELDTEGVIDE